MHFGCDKCIHNSVGKVKMKMSGKSKCRCEDNIKSSLELDWICLDYGSMDSANVLVNFRGP
jgi:hypothetical protein